MEPEIKTITCPNCSSRNLRKFGIKKNQLQISQKYQCKDCKKTFTLQTQIKNKTYPINIILTVFSLYNLGYTQTETINIISKRFKLKPSQKTISNWISDYKELLSFTKLREGAKKISQPGNMIEEYTFLHNNLPYNFQIHKAKLHLLFHSTKYNNQYNNQFTSISKFYEPIKQYLSKVPTEEFPHHLFQKNKEELESSRSSQMKFKTLSFIKIQKHNQANKLASLALNLAKTNRERHKAIQNFMLINDSTTITTEIPIYLMNEDIKYFKKNKFILNLENYKTPITGHIDILQIRNNLIHVLDYKPEASKVNAVNQLTIYALALASRTRLAVKNFKCAWFDDKDYFEFFPLHAVYKLRKVVPFS